MKTRVISAIVMVLLGVPLLIVGGLPFAIFLTIVSMLGLYELIHLKETKRQFPFLLKVFAYLLVMFLTLNNFDSIEFIYNLDYKVVSYVIFAFLVPLIYINDKDIFSMNDDKLAIFRRRQIGLIYQFYNLIPILDVEENIALPLELDGRNINRIELNEMLELLGLERRRHHLPSQLSGGQQQRTSIGRALITKPSIILADEPTGNLDSKASEEIVGLLRKSNKELKQTIIMITHNLELAEMADRIIKIEDGKIVKEA